VNSEKTKYMFMSRKKVRQKHSIKIANRSFEGVAKFKYLGTTQTDHNCRQEETKNRLNSGKACYRSVQTLLSSRLLPRNVKVKIYTTIIVPVVLYECETWSHTLTEEHRLMVFENRVLGRIFGQKRDEVTGEWRKLHREELHIVTCWVSLVTWPRPPVAQQLDGAALLHFLGNATMKTDASTQQCKGRRYCGNGVVMIGDFLWSCELYWRTSSGWTLFGALLIVIELCHRTSRGWTRVRSVVINSCVLNFECNKVPL
jgi:hypothetical protein